MGESYKQCRETGCNACTLCRIARLALQITPSATGPHYEPIIGGSQRNKREHDAHAHPRTVTIRCNQTPVKLTESTSLASTTLVLVLTGA
jgi:hypothetical protein